MRFMQILAFLAVAPAFAFDAQTLAPSAEVAQAGGTAAPPRRPAGRGTANPPASSDERAAGGRSGSATATGPGLRFGLPKAPPRTPGAIRIGSYNTLNLFDEHDDPRISGEEDDFKMRIDPDRAQGLANAIKAADMDIVALQEVESEEAVKWFRDRWLKDSGYEHVASRDVGNPRGIECAVMSRFPIVDVRTWTDANLDSTKREGEGWAARPADAPPQGKLRYQRSPLAVTVKTPEGYPLTVLSIHHKAGRDFNFQRESEALMTASLVRAMEKEDPARNIVVMGDFNAAPWDKSLRIYLHNGMVDAFAERTTDKTNPESRKWRTHESERVLDYILLNRAAFREFVPGSAFVLGTLHPGDQYDYQTDKPPKGYASDHYPVAIELLPKDVP